MAAPPTVHELGLALALISAAGNTFAGCNYEPWINWCQLRLITLKTQALNARTMLEMMVMEPNGGSHAGYDPTFYLHCERAILTANSSSSVQQNDSKCY